MGDRASSVGHLCIDLANVQMTGEDQRRLLRAVEATVVSHLAAVSASYKVVTISLSPNNGTEPEPPPPPQVRN